MQINPGDKGIDFAFGRPTPESIKKNGYKFVVRYLSVPPASTSKNLTTAERDVYLNAGLGILLVWEQSSTTPTKGEAEGLRNGKDAARLATLLGYPTDIPILVAVDTDTWANNVTQHEAYVRGFCKNLFPYLLGIYGDADILLRIGTLSKLGWMPNAKSWSAANKQKAIDAGLVHVQQHLGYSMDGVGVDPNTALASFKVWSKLSLVKTPPVEQVLPSIFTKKEDKLLTVTNSEDHEAFGTKGQAGFVLMDDGTLRHIQTMPEWILRDIEHADAKWTNDEIIAQGLWHPPVDPFTTTCNFVPAPTKFEGTFK